MTSPKSPKQQLSLWQIAKLWGGQHYVTMLPQFLSKEYRSFFFKKIREQLAQSPAPSVGPRIQPARLPRDARKRLVIATPHLLMAGAERFMQMAAMGFSQAEWDIILLKTEPAKPGIQTSDDRFTSYAKLIEAGGMTVHDLQDYMTHLNPDIFWIINSGKAYQTLPVLKKSLPHTKIVDTLFNVHDFHYTNYRLIDLIDLTTCENQIIYTQLKNRFGDTHQVACIPNGIDLTVFKPLSVPENTALTIGFCGRLSPIKNAKFMVPLAKALPDVSINFAGEGPLRQEIADAITEENLQNCHLLGAVSDMANFINRCDLVIVPSLMDGRPNIVMESIACGTPVLASDVGAIPEMIIHGKTGFLFPVNDVNGMAATIRQLQAHPDQLKQMRLDCAAYAVQHFDAAEFQRAYLKLFTAILPIQVHA